MTPKQSYFLVYFLLHVVLVLRTEVQTFNIENRNPWVKSLPDNQPEGSYFGFSVALHKTGERSPISQNWLLVGAPLGQNLQPGVNRSGALFKCPITENNEDCIQVKTDGLRSDDQVYEDEDDDQLLLRPQPDEIKTNQWLGVTVKSQGPGGAIIVCAHRYIQSDNLSQHHYGQGLCYVLKNNFECFEVLQHCKGKPTDKLHQQYGYCQAGVSAAFAGENTTSLVGAPGPYTWRGTIFAKDILSHDNFMNGDHVTYSGPLLDTDTIEMYSYVGMSVAGGHFLSKTDLTYASGAPRSKMNGQVFIFEKSSKGTVMNIPLIISGHQLASSFGYEILAVDIDKDGYDELLVGAPFYYDEKQGGAVYLYSNLKDCSDLDCTPKQTLYGKHMSRFGIAMTSLGDINKDGFNDVAIGAPYEEHSGGQHGAVYIYLGTKDGFSEKPSQVMRFTQLKTFGYSLSGGLDMDNNGYPDLLVGAYESEKAILFKTRPIIDIGIDIIGEEMKNINTSRKGCSADPGSKNTCFSIRSCFRISEKDGGSYKNFAVEYHVKEIEKFVNRIWFKDLKHPNKRNPESKRQVYVNGFGKSYCQDELVYIKEGVSDILSPIKFRVKYSLENNTNHSPILNKTSVKDFEATFQKDCGDDDVCISNLVLSAGTSLAKNAQDEYTVDMVNKDFILEANVTNYQESAYETRLYVFHPTALSYINLKTEKEQPTSAKCSKRNETLVVCDLGNPFHGNQTANLKLRFEIMKNTKEQKLDLMVFVNSTSQELSKQTQQNFVVILQKIAEFVITGKGTTNLFYGGQVTGESAMQHLEDIGARVVHRYGIDNRGQWDLPEVRVDIQWPYQVRPYHKDGDGKWLLYLESQPLVTGYDVTGLCEVPTEAINPLNLNLLQPEPENLMMPPEEFFKVSDNADSDGGNFTENGKTSSRRRRRREVEYVVEPREKVVNGIRRKVTVLNCIERTAKCIHITCYIRNLKKERQAFIEIKSRIWNSTLVEDYNDVDWVEIKSNAEIIISDKSFMTKDDQKFQFAAETLVYPETVHPYSGLNWWIIGGAVIAGLLLLIVLVVILYKCGFFKRKRVSKDPTLSGNLLMKEENDKLLTGKQT